MLVHQCTMLVLSKLTVYSLDSTVYHISSSKVVHINWHGLCIGLSIFNQPARVLTCQGLTIMPTKSERIVQAVIYVLGFISIIVVWMTA